MTPAFSTCSLPTTSFPELLPDTSWIHCLDLDVQIFDTDCFGVMWHGSYLKWMELGRSRLLNNIGIKLELPSLINDATSQDLSTGYIYPVSEQTLSFKAKAPYGEPLRLTTTLRLQGFKLIFEQTFRSRHPNHNEQITLQASTTVLVLNSQWKIQRRLPNFLLEALAANVESTETVSNAEQVG
jgi:acyl-CoA thioester hydrolase